MAFSRLKDAVSDVAETLRQVFSSPGCTEIPLAMAVPAQQAASLLAGTACSVSLEPAVSVQSVPCVTAPACGQECMVAVAKVQAEEQWQQWALGVPALDVPVFAASRANAVGIPPVPARGTIRKVEIALPTVASHGHRAPLEFPGVRKLRPTLAPPKAIAGLSLMLGLPVSIAGESWQSLNKALAMRYSMQLIKQTGENIRNLDVIGLFRIPVRGVRELRHDAKQNRLVLRLDPEAYRSERRQFILARRKADQTLVSCFLEES